MQGRKVQYKKSANLRDIINPFDLVDSDGDEQDESPGSNLPGELLVSFRKASKKDTISRLKSLEELRTTVSSNSLLDDVICSNSFSKHFAKLFARLSMDSERRVREMTFDLLLTICRDPVKRRCFVPIIAELAFYWVGAFFDPVGPVSDASRKAFDTCFHSNEKVLLFVNTVKSSCRKMVRECLDFRAEDARQKALADPDLADSAQMLYHLFLIRAISSEAFLSRYEYDSDLCDLIMRCMGSSTVSPILNKALFNYTMAVNLPPNHTQLVLDLALSDIDNADIVLRLILEGRFGGLPMDGSRLAEYCRRCISDHTKSIIPVIKQVISAQSPSIQSLITSACLRPNTLDTHKLVYMVENLFCLASDSRKSEVFEFLIIRREPPWINIELNILLDSLTKSFGAEFVKERLLSMDCSASVPLLVYSFNHHLQDMDHLVDCLGKLDVSTKEISLILSSQRLASHAQITNALVDKYASLVSNGQMTSFLKYFDMEKLLSRASNKSFILDFIAQNGSTTSPWLVALKDACGDEELLDRLILKMLTVAEYSDRLMSIVSEHHLRGVPQPSNSWLESERFTVYLIQSGHSSLALGHIVRRLGASHQLQYIGEASFASSYLDQDGFESFCHSICRAKVGFKRHLLLDCRDNDPPKPFIDNRVFDLILEKHCFPADLRPHIIVYCMWIDDRYHIDHSSYYGEMMRSIGTSEISALSRKFGGYYSQVYQALSPPDSEVPVCLTGKLDDHSIVCCRLNVGEIDAGQVSDLDVRISIIVPVLSHVSNDTINGIFEGYTRESVSNRLFAIFLDYLSNPDAVESNAEIIYKFLFTTDVYPFKFLVNYPAFVSEALKTTFIDQFVDATETCNLEGLCAIIRQIAPFNLCSFNPIDIINLIDIHGRTRTARFIFNLLHDQIIEQLQASLSLQAGMSISREKILFSKLSNNFFSPASLEALELLVGFAEACKESPLVLSAVVQATCIDDALTEEILSALGWINDGKSPIDLTTTEFTGIDWDEEEVDEHILCANLLFRAFRVFAPLLRTSLAHYERRIEKHMIDYMSPVIIHRELDKCRRFKRNSSHPNASLKLNLLASSTQKLIQAKYVFEDAELSLSIDIPASYPVQPLSIDASSGRKGVSEAKWKTALLSATPIINSTCDIMEGLKVWSANLDKQLAGIEPCSICYCVLHPTDRTLPTPQCRTCSHRFHSACLYKWFRTGGQATCPLCRSLF